MPIIEIIKKLIDSKFEISTTRQALLRELAKLILSMKSEQSDLFVNFICTHNSRRSQLAELWFLVLSHHYKIESISVGSGGTESTAFNHRMVSALREFGFDLEIISKSDNPIYALAALPDHTFYSKKYDNQPKTVKDYLAVMVCDHADDNCPLVFGAKQRFALKYVDPKVSDDTPEESATYHAKVVEIGQEMNYLCRLIALRTR